MSHSLQMAREARREAIKLARRKQSGYRYAVWVYNPMQQPKEKKLFKTLTDARAYAEKKAKSDRRTWTVESLTGRVMSAWNAKGRG
jgi:hypothetical protein